MLALVWLVAPVDPGVLLELGGGAELSRTVRALAGLPPLVAQHVDLERRRLAVRPGAQLALVRLLSGVDQPVFLEAGRCPVLRLALLALECFRL